MEIHTRNGGMEWNVGSSFPPWYGVLCLHAKLMVQKMQQRTQTMPQHCRKHRMWSITCACFLLWLL